MTILPKKKTSQQKSDGDSSDSNAHSHTYHGDRLGHQPLAPDSRERFNFPTRNSPPSWPLPPSREEKRPSQSSNPPFEDVENGPSHSKRRHRASPHRNVRKTHHRSNAPQNYQTAPGPSQGGHSPTHERQSSTVTVEVAAESNEDHTGYNSGDEYDRPTENWTEDDYSERERIFEKKMRKKNFMIKAMGEDGACLFRAVADQVYGDQEMHSSIRKLCMDYMAKNADYYSQYITEDFEKYVERKRCDKIHGNHVEMQAMSEMFNRPIEVYHYSLEPINIFHGMHKTDNEPIRLSYHRNVHYNSIVDPFKATVGVGLGLPAFKPGAAEKNLMTDAIRASEESELEQAMLEDKLRATDWEATNEAIEEQVARESYLEWMRENEMRARKKTRTASATSSSTVSAAPEPANSGSVTPQGAGRISPRSRAITPTCSPRLEALHAEEKNGSSDYMGSPKAGCSGTTVHSQPSPHHPAQSYASNSLVSGTKFGGFSVVETASFMNQLPPSIFGLSDWEDTDILARVLAQSQQEYLDSLKRTAATKDNQTTS